MPLGFFYFLFFSFYGMNGWRCGFGGGETCGLRMDRFLRKRQRQIFRVDGFHGGGVLV